MQTLSQMDSKREDSSVCEDSDDGFAVITSKKVLLKDRVKQLTEENKGLDDENSWVEVADGRQRQ